MSKKARKKPAALTPKSKAALEALGYAVARVEHWNSWARIRQDLFGMFDLLGVGPNGTIAVQVTSADNVSARVRKIRASTLLPAVLAAGWVVQVHGWYKDGRRWDYSVTRITAPENEP